MTLADGELIDRDPTDESERSSLQATTQVCLEDVLDQCPTDAEMVCDMLDRSDPAQIDHIPFKRSNVTLLALREEDRLSKPAATPATPLFMPMENNELLPGSDRKCPEPSNKPPLERELSGWRSTPSASPLLTGQLDVMHDDPALVLRSQVTVAPQTQSVVNKARRRHDRPPSSRFPPIEDRLSGGDSSTPPTHHPRIPEMNRNDEWKEVIRGEMKNFAAVVREHARKRPDHPAYIFMGQTLSYRQFDESINRVANSFLGLGLKPGDKVATILPQSPAFITVYLAAAVLGLVVVPLDPRFKAAEMITLCQRTKPKVLIGLGNPEPVKKSAEALIAEVGFEAVYYFFGPLESPGAKPYEALLESSAAPPAMVSPEPDMPLIIIFTSGSTGRPKGAVISHRNTIAIARATCEAWKLSASDKAIVNLPTSHVGGTHDLIAVQLYAGATGVIMPTFNPPEMLEIIGKYQITYFGGVPTMYRLLFNQCRVSDYDVSSVHLAIVSGEPSPPELIRQIQENFPNTVVGASWGMSETAGFFTFTALDDPLEVVAATEGRPGDDFKLRIAAPDGSPLPTGEVGELLVQGDSVIATYMDPEDNQGAFHEGWLKTGDLGFLDENDYLHFIGRVKEMYISGGYNVYPLEIESFLNRHPKINTSCIIEMPDELYGETGCAFIIPEQGSELTVEEVQGYCREHLADYKRPKRVIIRNDLPKTLIGKLAKQEIRKNLEAYF
jgi:fatty-acyl-CoA synthase